MLGFLVASITDVGHFVLTLEATANSVVNTLQETEKNKVFSGQAEPEEVRVRKGLRRRMDRATDTC